MTTPNETQPKTFSHINGTTEELLDRFAVSELCRGWPVYRDASEWKNFRDIFCEKDAHIWTTWSGPVPVDEFIKVSQQGKANGDFIMHRECGTMVDLNPATSRAVGKMKTTITQRFKSDGIEYDVDCDNTFIFFCLKQPSAKLPGSFNWKVKYYKVFYAKDKVVPVDGYSVPTFSEEELKPFPEGYKFLGAAQGRLGHKIDTVLPTFGNEYFYRMYEAIQGWLEGKEIDLFWE